MKQNLLMKCPNCELSTVVTPYFTTPSIQVEDNPLTLIQHYYVATEAKAICPECGKLMVLKLFREIPKHDLITIALKDEWTT